MIYRITDGNAFNEVINTLITADYLFRPPVRTVYTVSFNTETKEVFYSGKGKNIHFNDIDLKQFKRLVILEQI